MTLSKIIKLMLIRIGDERREMLDQHLVALKMKCLDFTKYEADTKDVLTQTLITVITNLPHKVLVYSNFIAMLAQDDANYAQEIISIILKHLSIFFINEQDDLKSRSIFRWLANLVDVRVIDSKSVCQFLLGFLDEVQKA